MKWKKEFLLILIFIVSQLNAQEIQLLHSGNKVSLRGLSVVNDHVFWASGSKGTVARSTDGGKTIAWMQVSGYAQRDFRDIHAFDSNTAIIMGIAEPAVMLRTEDAGKTWNKVFEDTTKGMFLDALDFQGSYGVVIGDPIKDSVYLAMSTNGGRSWQKIIPENNCAVMQNGEAFFASSGSNIQWYGRSSSPKFAYISGGTQSRLLINNQCFALPMLRDKNSTGANALAISGKQGVIVGGDFAADSISTGNLLLFSTDSPIAFKQPNTAPRGYKSSVVMLNKQQWLVCGTSGVDVSDNAGKDWRFINKTSFHVAKKSAKGQTIYLAGGDGRIAKLVW